MSAISSIAGVEARIARLTSRFAPAGAPGAGWAGLQSTEVGAPADPLAGFDPFGAVYQEALAQAGPAAAAPSMVAGGGHTARTEGGATYVGGSGGVWSTGGVAPAASSGAGGSAPAGGAHVPGSSVGKVGGYGKITVPPELQGYGNGRIPADALQPIGQGGHRLWAPAAESWKNMVAAAAAEGIELRVTDSYRSYEQQVDLAERKGLYEHGGVAAVPGTSNHGWGMAVDADVTDPTTLAWVRANAYRFGYVEAVPREPWHWEYRPAQA